MVRENKPEMTDRIDVEIRFAEDDHASRPAS